MRSLWKDVTTVDCKQCYQRVCLCALTQYGVSALQSVRVFVTAQVIDVIAQITGAVQLLCHHHLLMHQVRLRKIHSCLQNTHRKRKPKP